MSTATAPEVPQHMKALALANKVNRGQAELKREVRAGTTSIREALWDPRAQGHCFTIGSLLGAQERWGPIRVRRLLMRLGIPETRTVARLTDRQRGLVVDALK